MCLLLYKVHYYSAEPYFQYYLWMRLLANLTFSKKHLSTNVEFTLENVVHCNLPSTCHQISQRFYLKDKWMDEHKVHKLHMGHLMTKPTKWHMRPAKTRISLGIRLVWSESSLSAWRKMGSLATHWVHNKDSDQTGLMPSLIRVFTWRIDHFAGFVMRWLNKLSPTTGLDYIQIKC